MRVVCLFWTNLKAEAEAEPEKTPPPGPPPTAYSGDGEKASPNTKKRKDPEREREDDGKDQGVHAAGQFASPADGDAAKEMTVTESEMEATDQKQDMHTVLCTLVFVCLSC